ncbi:MFS transporter [Rhodovibrionaceae bacterium A322]
MKLSKQGVLVSWVLALGMFVIGTTSLSILGVGPTLTRELAVSPGDAGWLVTAFAATFALVAPIAQFSLGARVSPRKLIIIGTIILTSSLVWAALATDFSSLLLSRVAAAVGSALVAPTSAALAISLVPDDRRGAVLAIVFTGFTLATVAGVPITTWLTLWFGWRGAMAAIAGAAILLLVLVLICLPGEAKKEVESKAKLVPKTGDWNPVMVLLATLGMLATQFILYALMGEVLGRSFGVSDKDLPFAILLFGIFGVAGNTAAGFLTDRVGAEILVWLSIGALAVLLLLGTANLGPLLGPLVLAGCAFAGTLFATPQQSRLVALVPQEHYALILAMNSSASYLGIALGSGLASLVAANAGLSALPVAALCVLAVTAAINRAAGRFPANR